MGKSIRTSDFGALEDGRHATLYTLTNNRGICLKLTDYGAAAVAMLVPDSYGAVQDVIWGFDSVSGYERTKYYLGATIGRFAGQINGGRFSLDGCTYGLTINDHGNTLHGGVCGFDKRLFSGIVAETENKVAFSYYSPDGEGGFPGNLEVQATYTLTPQNEIIIQYQAVSDADTVLNLTNHSYFNLDGHDSTSILKHTLSIHGEEYTDVAPDGSPNGRISSVADTPMDFRNPHEIGERIGEDFEQLRICGGYDHNWVIDRRGEGVRMCCELAAEKSTRRLQVLSNQPGLQMYSGNYLDGTEIGKNGVLYAYRSALCLEAQLYPNALNHPAFPSPILRRNEVYHNTIIYRFLGLG